MNRLILCMLAITSISLHAAQSTKQDEQAPKISVGVIGAGLAGMTAAYRLHQAGYQVTVYEARDRIGGRVYTYRNHDGSYEELGGSSIPDGGAAPHMRALIAECGLSTFSKTGVIAPWVYNNKREKKDMHTTIATIKSLDDPQLQSLIEQEIPKSENLDELLLKITQGNTDLHDLIALLAQADLTQMPADAYMHFSDKYEQVYYASKMAMPTLTIESIKNGNDSLPKALAEKIGIKNVLLHSPIQAVTIKNNKVQITHSNNKTGIHDVVVYAAPLTSLRRVTISDEQANKEEKEALQKRLNLLKESSYAKISKILYKVTTNEASAKAYQTACMPYYLAFMPEGELWSNIDGTILTYYINRYENTTLTPEKIASCAEHIKEHFPFLTQVTPVASMDWANDEYALGTWSLGFRKKDMPLDEYIDQSTIESYGDQEIIKAYSPIKNRIFFAGEHTVHSDGSGCMEGACESGDKAFMMIKQIYH